MGWRVRIVRCEKEWNEMDFLGRIERQREREREGMGRNLTRAIIWDCLDRGMAVITYYYYYYSVR